MTLSLDREPATSAAWLGRHQSVVVVARDRGGGVLSKQIAARVFSALRLDSAAANLELARILEKLESYYDPIMR